MNSICFFQHEISDNETIIFSDSKRLGHIQTHLKSSVGDILKVTILNTGIFEALIEEISSSRIKIKIQSELPASRPWFNLLVGLSRPQTIKKVLEHSTTFGAKSFSLFRANLSQKSYASSKIYENDTYQEYLIDGLAQSKTYFNLPDFELETYLNLQKFESQKNKFFLSLNSQSSFLDFKGQLDNPLIAIGPERGWTAKEEQKLTEAGFRPIKISHSCLRVEHAIYSAVSQLEMISLNKK
ncbi:RsmE family RNA methyltransferase [Halobacteriovorax sp. HLS]|uniref:RsmE family RNA methyltransferase n=1 Tax=Halobacteriovorax sp. HLS TaxID=2234000 RepID=UPI000FD7EF49|nr:RsmE family RNA methyltransferase [Halobacteriovorax sp. HLS]